MRKAVKVDKEEVRMSSAEMYHRLLCVAYTNGPPAPEVFTYELTPVSPALFHDDGSMRKSQKCSLAKHILDMDPDMMVQSLADTRAVVYDGCAILHRLTWPKVGSMKSVCEAFSATAMNEKALVWVIFDSYEVTIT